MIQEVIVGIFFLGALVYLGRLCVRQFRTKSGCASGCGQCKVIDFADIEKKIIQASGIHRH